MEPNAFGTRQADTATPPPHIPALPFNPSTHNPSTDDVARMIDSRIELAREQNAYNQALNKRKNVIKAVAVGVGGFAVGVGGTMLVGRMVRNRRARMAGGVS